MDTLQSMTGFSKTASKLAKSTFYKASLIKDFIDNMDLLFKSFTKELKDLYNDKIYLACKTYLKHEGTLLFRKKDYGVYKNSLNQREFIVYEYWIIKGVPIKFFHPSSEKGIRIVFPLFANVNKFLDNVRTYLDKLEWPTIEKELIVTNFYYLTEENKKVIRELRFWLDNRSWFNNRDIAYKRTYLLIGPPGTGKSKFVKNISEALDIDTDKLDIIKTFSNANKNDKQAPATFGDDYTLQDNSDSKIILMEDVDRVDFQKIRLDKFLNYLDGVDILDNKLLFITCNDESKLPEALKRPGRIDRIVYFKTFDNEGLKHIASNIFTPERAEEILNMYHSKKWIEKIDRDNLCSPAHFTQFCTDLSMREFQEKLDNI